MISNPTSVLFMCTTNAVRSAMAEALLRHLHGHELRVASAGVREGELDLFAVAVIKEIGLDISGHTPRTLDEIGEDTFDLLIPLSPDAHHRAMELTREWDCEVEFWNTMDATAMWGSREQRLTAYRQVRDGLLRRIGERFPSLPPPTV